MNLYSAVGSVAFRLKLSFSAVLSLFRYSLVLLSESAGAENSPSGFRHSRLFNAPFASASADSPWRKQRQRKASEAAQYNSAAVFRMNYVR